MFNTLHLVMAAVTGVLIGTVGALKVIAPRTKTRTDDDVLKKVEWALEQLEKLGLKPPVPR